MRLGIGSHTYAWAIGVPGYPPPQPMTAWRLIGRAAALGLGVVQVCDNLPLDRLAMGQLATLGEQAERQQVTLELGTRGATVERLRVQLRLAAQLQAPLLRVVIDAPERRPPQTEVIRLLGEVLPECEQRGITLALENHGRFTARQCAEIITSLGSPRAGICLDTVNSFGALEGPAVVVDILAPYTVSLHLKDFAIGRLSHQMGFLIEGRPAGQGQLDVPWLLDRLETAGRNPNAVLELWTPPEPAVEDTIAKEARWAEQSVAYLRQFITE